MSFDLIITSGVSYIKSRDCGYCHGSKNPMESGYSLDSYRKEYLGQRLDKFKDYPNNTTIGFTVYTCSPQCYERLMDRGFRRSGTFIYRPDLLRNCCRLYTIRTSLDLIKHPSKGQRHTINRFEKFIKSENVRHVKNGKHVAGKPFDIKEHIINLEKEVDPSRFRTEICSTEVTQEKFSLYKKYQIRVHNDKPEKVSISGFKRFLCQTPFARAFVNHSAAYWEDLNVDWREGVFENSRPDEILGPIHECYYLDNKLIAIGVLDVLPQSLSSVYFIWDPDYAHLGLGNLSALHELVLTKMLGKKYYYMGYYIDDCPKMNYKAKFGGEILDICNRKYMSLDKADDFINQGRFAIFQEESNKPSHNVTLNELEIDDNTVGRFDHDATFTNIAEEIYGKKGGAFEKAIAAAMKICLKLPALQVLNLEAYRQEEYWEPDEGLHSLPVVSPGLIPLWQMNEWINDGQFDRLIKNAYVFDGDQSFERFDTDRDWPKLIEIFNFVRLLGPKEFEKPLLFTI